jgi:response regulator RpfG family c-di-GMP phosphodiesterase
VIRRGSPGRPVVLVIDDEVGVLESVADLLRTEYDVWATTDVAEALGVLEREDVALILADQRMPATSGVEFLSRVAGIRPDAVRVLFTGYSDIEAVIHAINDGQVYRYVSKPWTNANLTALASEATARHYAASERRRLVEGFTRLGEGAGGDALPPPADLADTDRVARENDGLRAALAQLKNSHWHIPKAQEVLPICMECHKVWTSADGWSDLATFLRRNSSFLSHGYCPECGEQAMQAATRLSDDPGRR